MFIISIIMISNSENLKLSKSCLTFRLFWKNKAECIGDIPEFVFDIKGKEMILLNKYACQSHHNS